MFRRLSIKLIPSAWYSKARRLASKNLSMKSTLRNGTVRGRILVKKKRNKCSVPYQSIDKKERSKSTFSMPFQIVLKVHSLPILGIKVVPSGANSRENSATWSAVRISV